MRQVLVILIIAAAVSAAFTINGDYLGQVDSVDRKTGEIIVTGPNLGSGIKMGDTLYVIIDGEKVLLTARFPMMTIAKCRIAEKSSQYLDRLTKGMKVYRYTEGPGKEKMHALPVKSVGGIDFVHVPGGSFIMGSPDSVGKENEHPRHRVTLSGFWMGKYEVTQQQYEEITGQNPSGYKGDPNLPVEQVSWNEAVDFCRKFQLKYGVAVRLPTEAEWEYACRAGSVTKYHWGDAFNGDYCWNDGNSGVKTKPVGTKLPNTWGLHDMSGNVWEWCQDWYGDYSMSAKTVKNPRGPASGTIRTERGGGWYYYHEGVRSAFRGNNRPDFRHNFLGFRIVMPE